MSNTDCPDSKPSSESNNVVWIEKVNYWVTDAPQLSKQWFAARRCRVTSSKISGLVGRSRFEDTVKAAYSIARIYKEANSQLSKDAMFRGRNCEPIARNWYAEIIDRKINEIGLVVPKWDVRFGGSADGIIDDDNIIEIKVPRTIYKPLLYHRQSLNNGCKYDLFYHDHIYDTHYDQMQLNMAVTGAKYCHYIVYSPSSETQQFDYYTEIVPFNSEHWDNIYKKACEMYVSHIEPIMAKYTKVKRIDP